MNYIMSYPSIYTGDYSYLTYLCVQGLDHKTHSSEQNESAAARPSHFLNVNVT